MRFVVVEKRQAADAKTLLAEAQAVDVELVIVGHGKIVDTDTLSRLPRNSSIAIVGVHRRIVRKQPLTIECDVGTVIGARTTLLAWLRPDLKEAIDQPVAPATAFRNAERDAPALLIAKHALDAADELPEDRFGFANRAASALSDLARTGQAKPSIDGFFESRSLNLARSGRTTYAIKIWRDGRVILTDSTQWHLSQGGATTKVHAARIYFYKFVVSRRSYVLVLHVGPHPDDYVTKDVAYELPPSEKT